MANSGNNPDNGFSNIGYVNDETTGASQIPSAPQEQFGVPKDWLPSHSTTSLKSGVVPRGSRLPSKDGISEHGHARTESEDETQGGSCGYCCCLPAFLQPMASGRVFVFFLCILSLTESGLTVGYISSMVTSFELLFKFSSTLTGFVVSCYDIGTLVVILTSYFGGRAAAHRPKWIAWSAWTMVLGSSIVTLPHFFITYQVQGNDTSQALCHADQAGEFEDTFELEKSVCPPGDDSKIEGPALVFLIPGMLLIGAGSTATLTLGTTYIDDFVHKKEAPILLALVYSTTVIGPALGFLVGSLFLKYYVDFDTVSHVHISPSSPRWVGAWWLGFFFFAGAILLMAIPIFAFPAKLKKTKGTLKELKDEDDDDDDMKVRMAFSDVSLSKIPLAIWGLLKNPVYMMVNVAAAAEFSIVTGFVRFAPKFLQSQFELNAGKANLLTGTLIPVGALGVITGGLILNRVSPSLRSTVNVLCASTIVSGLLYGIIYIPGPCPNSEMAGITKPYNCSDTHWHRPIDPKSGDLESPCNAQCSCDSSVYSPICTSTGLAYFNPCFAGCQTEQRDPKASDNETFLYFNCTCFEDYNTSLCNTNPNTASRYEKNLLYTQEAEANATTGLCVTNCNLLAPFISLFLVLVFFSAAQQMPALMTLLRCVKKEERPFALGLQFVIIRLLGYIPSPIYYGAVIDSSCILWQNDCKGEDGACLMYDNSGFFYGYMGLSTILKCVSLCMAVLVYILVRRMHVRWATATQLPPAPISEDSAVVTDSAESLQKDSLSKKISTSEGYGSTDEVPTIKTSNMH